MHAKRIPFVVLAVISALLAGCSGGARMKAPSLGYVEHRGQQYTIRNLMDPQYRLESCDRFARVSNASLAPSAIIDLQ